MGKNSEQTIREARKSDVVSCFFSLLKEYPNEKIGDIFKRVEKHPAPRFYVTVENARRFTAAIAKNRKLQLVNRRKREMYFDVYRLWQEDCAKKSIEPLRPRGSFKYFANTGNITENFLKRQAPSFYLALETIKEIVYRELRRK